MTPPATSGASAARKSGHNTTTETPSETGHPNLGFHAFPNGNRLRTRAEPYDEIVGSRAATALYVLALVAVVVGAVVVGVDVVFFRHHVWGRLIANVGIVLLFAAFYLRFRM